MRQDQGGRNRLFAASETSDYGLFQPAGQASAGQQLGVRLCRLAYPSDTSPSGPCHGTTPDERRGPRGPLRRPVYRATVAGAEDNAGLGVQVIGAVAVGRVGTLRGLFNDGK